MNHIVDLLIQYRYIIIIPLALFEGPVVMMISGFLLKLGYFSFLPLYFLLMPGDLLGDILWYSVGFFYGNRFIKTFGKFVSVTEENVEIVKKIFHRYHTKILVVSKITMGFGFALVTLIAAGMVKIPFKRYLALNAFGQFFWTGILLAVGFFLGNFYVKINSVLGKASTLALFAITLACLYGFGKYIRKRTTQQYSE